MTNLYTETRHLHHETENHEFAKAMRDKGRDLPNNHVFFEHSKEVEMYITELREMVHLTKGAEHAFNSITGIFDEIWGKQ